MSDASDTTPVRAEGAIRASFARSAARTHVASLYEAGGLRLKFPRTREVCEAIIVNTAGGVVGGDRASLSFAAQPNARVMLTTQAAEKIYRSDGTMAQIDVALSVDTGARVEWLPQETILFDRARLRRRLEIDLAGDASMTVLEMIVFGRLGMGEVMDTGLIRDDWRVRRDGTLVFAEALRLDGTIRATLDRPAGGAGARAVATLLHLAPDAEGRLEDVRGALGSEGLDVGVSAWNGFLIARFADASPARLRACIVGVLTALRGTAMPRVWQ